MTENSSRHKLAGRIGGLTRAARKTNEQHRKDRAKAGFMARFHALVPAEITDPVERARRAELFMRAHMAAIGKKSADSRRKPKRAA